MEREGVSEMRKRGTVELSTARDPISPGSAETSLASLPSVSMTSATSDNVSGVKHICFMTDSGAQSVMVAHHQPNMLGLSGRSR